MKDKRILFIGGNRGIGFAAAKIAHSLGAEVLIAGRDSAYKDLDGYYWGLLSWTILFPI